MNEQRYPLDWIDEYVARLRDYVFVREADNLLIKVPNEAHKLNDSGIRILKRLLGGDSVLDLWAEHDRSPAVREDLYNFFIGLKQVLQGCVDERRLPASVTAKPFSLDFNSLPVLSEVALTYRCNLQCRFCYAGCTCRKQPDSVEMTTEKARQILRIIRHEAEVPSTSFTGGEPTLRTDLPELVRYARHDLGMRVNLITNGTLVDEAMAQALGKSGLHSAQVSLESPDESVHDRLTQVPGSFQKSLRGVRTLLNAGIRVHTNTTINRVNLHTVPDMPALVQDLGLERFSMNMVIPCGTAGQVGTALRAVRGAPRETRGKLGACSAGGGERALPHSSDINLQYSEVSEVILRVKEAAECAGVEFMWYSPTPVCMFNPIQHKMGNKGCAACDGLLSVSPTGDVLPCSSWDEPTGNLLKDGFASSWRSARATWIRNKEFAPQLCRGCEDFALCQSACPLYWRHFGYDELVEYGERYVSATV